ncbi:MAG: ATP-grasp domain-containing protein [Archangium sp.]|nr:ATP-grasp domain-containing protein [Archangium sp.]
MPTVGILGGGQLGLMLAESLDRLGHDVVVLEADADSPCAQRRSNVISGGPGDPTALATFFSRVDIATFDSENTPAPPLAPWAAKLAPSLRVLEITQDRAKEKTFLRDQGFRTVKFELVAPGADVKAAVHRFGLPCIAKSVLGGYDGKGQHRLLTETDVSALPASAPGGWVLEEVLQLESEVSCLVARDARSSVTFPIFENLHAHHILDLTVLPARVAPALQDEARQVADGIARALDLVGLLTVEFFIGTGRDGARRLYVNELAPRVHNSGHVTRQACTVSQFDALARILAGVPVVQPEVHRGAWCMGQLLGEVWLAQGRTGGALDLTAWKDFPDVVDVYVYGKREARAQRKMGHFVVHADTPERAMERAVLFRQRLRAR